VLNAAVAGAAALSLAACASDSGGGDGSVIKLGFVYQGGGGLNATSVAYVHGMQVAVDELNKAGGITVDGTKYTFALDTCNDHFDQTQTTGCANKLVLDSGDKFMFGGFADFGPIIRGVTERHKVVYFSTGPAVAALMSQSKYVVDVVPTNEVRAKADVAAIQKLYPDAKRLALLGDQALVWDQDVADIKTAIQGTDLQIVGEEKAPLTLNDFSALLTSLKGSNPDVLVSFMTSPARSKAILEENARLHVVDKFFDPSANCGAINAGNTGVAIAANTNTGAVLNGTEASDLAKKYVTNYYSNGYSPNPDPNIANALYAYDNIGWLKQAMEKAGSIDDVDKILQAMNSITYTGINGTISMKANQQTYGQVVCYSANGGPPFKEVLIPPAAS
jgi:ABC-type branched-subunit amino acid transport system substrate-binding protein